MIAFAFESARSWHRRWVRPVGRWIRRHPRWTVVLLVLAWMVISEIGGTMVLANAADGGTDPSLPYLSPLNPHDSGGVDLVHYVSLPLQRGDLLHPDQLQIGMAVDAIWTWQLTSLSWVLWLFQFLLSFDWVSWITTPLDTIFTFFSGLLAQIGWAPVALALTGLVCGMVIWAGRVGVGLAEVGVSLFAFVLVTGVMFNPVGFVTGQNGLLTWVKNTGREIAASIANDKPQLVDGANAAQSLNSTITGQLMDLWLRAPAQEISFGKILTGRCAKVFSHAMMARNPLDSGDNSVRDAVAACDPAAGEYVNHPSLGQVFTAATISTGVTGLQFAGIIFALLLIAAVFAAVFQAAKLLFALYAAIAPGVARHALWRACIGMFVSALAVGAMVILLSGFLRVITSVMTALSTQGWTILNQTAVIDVFMFVLLGLMVYMWWRMHKAGSSLAERLARLGFGRASSPKSSPVKATAKRIGEEVIARRITRRKTAPEAAKNAVTARPGVAPAPINLTATRAAGDAAKTASTAAKALPAAGTATKALGAGATAAGAAATGGASAVVMAAGKIAGGYVLQRAVRKAASKKGPVPTSPTNSADRAAFTGFGRRIVVDETGTSRIEPRQAPQHGGVYRITNVPGRRSPADSPARTHLREVVQRAQAGQA